MPLRPLLHLRPVLNFVVRDMVSKSPLQIGEGQGEVQMHTTHPPNSLMHKHLPRYTKSLISRSRKLRRDMTDAERKLWSLLRNNRLGLKFRRQVPYDLYLLDFYCLKAKLVIEVLPG